MKLIQSLTATALSLCLVGPMYGATRHHHHHYTHHRTTRSVQVVDVNAHVFPPGPPHARHVIVVNSAERGPRHHGVAGAFQRLHTWHMRQRAHLYRQLTK
jgi:hypothetical protein